MPTFQSVAEFKRAIDKMEADLKERQRATGLAMAEKAKAEGYRAAAADLGGDPKFSGWKPWLELKVKSDKDGAVLMPTRSSAGPWTVAERGRNQGNASGFSGPGINVRTGLTSRTKSGGIRAQRSRKAKRWNGYTQGKGTATEAVARFERLTADIPEKHLKIVIRRHFD
jgi:hypothetical protein